jgi:hypothetical protein
MDENDEEEEETGSVRRDFKFGASNYIVSVPLKREKKKIISRRFFLFVVEEGAEKYFPSPLRQIVIGKKEREKKKERELKIQQQQKPADDLKCL